VLADDPEPAPDEEQDEHRRPGEQTDQTSPSKVGLVAYQESPTTELDSGSTTDSVRNVGEI
jgi:hypothetical protein